jgi:hypothetical protein
VNTGALEKRLEALETRMGQLIQASDDMRASFYRIMLSIAMVVGFMVVLWIGWSIVSSWWYRNEPPVGVGTLEVPLQVNDKVVYLMVDVKGWKLPPGLQDDWFQAELKRRMTEAEKAKAQQGTTTQPTTQQNR